jgi:hypothetical protein
MAKGKTTDEPPGPGDTPSNGEGLELIRAFEKIKSPDDRQKVIELAKRLSA